MNKLLLSASVLAAVVTAIHVVAGGNDVAAPLLASALPEAPKLTLYAVWHMVSALLGMSAVVFGMASHPRHIASLSPAARVLAILWLGSGLVFLLVAATQPGEGLFLKLPQWALLLPVASLAWLGANGSSKPTPLRGAA
jgi:hypothetical protein